MSWMRVERYWEGEFPDVKARFLPVFCQHCGNAPCEPVCPVYATYHSLDGLNIQVYNRCVGTRFCANNDPYNVRFFNWWEPIWPDIMRNYLNPDVTVRSKGIMEKCTMCVQRIRRAERTADRDGREINDGELKVKDLNTCIEEGQTKLRPIDAYDAVMHASDAVLSGGVRRSATICLFSPDDLEMATAKTGNWFND